MNNSKRWNASKNKSFKSSRIYSNPRFFLNAFKKRLGRTPSEYINEKLKNGSQLDAVKYLFNIVAAEISNQNNCKFFDFDYFYKTATTSKPQPKPGNFPKTKRPENAGKAWTKEEELLLIKMYNSGASNKEMCDKFKRTEIGIAARLVKLGVIKERKEFRDQK